MAATKEERFKKICEEKIKFPNRENCTDQMRNLCKLIEELLHKNPSKRLGGLSQDYHEVLQHPVFDDININRLMRKEY